MGQWFGMKEGIVSCRGKAAPPLEHACWGRWTLVVVPGDAAKGISRRTPLELRRTPLELVECGRFGEENWEVISGDTLGDDEGFGPVVMTTLGSWMA